MDKVLSFHQGRLPLLISMPHAGLNLTAAVRDGLVEPARSLPDTDWHIPRLYDVARELGASVVAAEYSRFVIDLNRPDDDKPLYVGATTGLYPATLFDGEPLFKDAQVPTAGERATYLERIWRPYHDTIRRELARLREEFGYALLWDAHSIRSVIPHLFDGKLPDFNLGTFNGASCDPVLAERLLGVCAEFPAYSHVLNGRFKGGTSLAIMAIRPITSMRCNWSWRRAPTWKRKNRSPTAKTWRNRPRRSCGACWKPPCSGRASATVARPQRLARSL